MTATHTGTKEIRVHAIKNGTVIDHLPSGYSLPILKILGGVSEKKIITLGINLKSKALGRKDLIKIEDRELTQEEVDQIALMAPRATINIIRNFTVAKKIRPQLPRTLKGVVRCPNPRCITNHEIIATLFHTIIHKKQVALMCHYCEKQFPQAEIIRYV